MNTPPTRLAVVAAGGTGGHLFPAEALARELQGRGWHIVLATDTRGARYAEHFPAEERLALDAATFKMSDPVGVVRGLLRIEAGVRAARAAFRRLEPAVVVGFGGYPSLPALLAAKGLHLPRVIHEQNAVLGRVNRFLSRRVEAVACAFPLLEKAPAGLRPVVVGNPVRPPIRALYGEPYEAPGETLRLLVTGGSQGARVLSEVVPTALASLPEALRTRLRVAQQTRPENLEAARNTYAEAGVEAQVEPFFADMAERLRVQWAKGACAAMWRLAPPLQRIARMTQPHDAPPGAPNDAPPGDALLRHLRRCDDAALPGPRLPLLLAGEAVGLVLPSLLPSLLAHGARRTPGGVDLPDPARLEPLARALADAGAFPWRDEPFDVRARADGPVLARADRGAMPPLGLVSVGAHLDGLVRRADGPHLWVARRSMSKRLDPGLLDHLAAGGVPAGLTPRETLLKEAAEECGLPPELAARATEHGVIAYACERPEGLRRDRLHCFALDLPESFAPRPMDGEVASFELWPLPRVLRVLREGDAFKFNVALVLVQLLLREGLLPPAQAAPLRAGLEAMTRRQRDAAFL